MPLECSAVKATRGALVDYLRAYALVRAPCIKSLFTVKNHHGARRVVVRFTQQQSLQPFAPVTGDKAYTWRELAKGVGGTVKREELNRRHLKPM